VATAPAPVATAKKSAKGPASNGAAPAARRGKTIVIDDDK
jgi:hypothetical protein